MPSTAFAGLERMPPLKIIELKRSRPGMSYCGSCRQSKLGCSSNSGTRSRTSLHSVSYKQWASQFSKSRTFSLSKSVDRDKGHLTGLPYAIYIKTRGSPICTSFGRLITPR